MTARRLRWVAVAALVVVEYLFRLWMRDGNAADLLLSRGASTPPSVLAGAAAFILFRIAAVLLVPGLLAVEAVTAVEELVARGRDRSTRKNAAPSAQ